MCPGHLRRDRRRNDEAAPASPGHPPAGVDILEVQEVFLGDPADRLERAWREHDDRPIEPVHRVRIGGERLRPVRRESRGAEPPTGREYAIRVRGESQDRANGPRVVAAVQRAEQLFGELRPKHGVVREHEQRAVAQVLSRFVRRRAVARIVGAGDQDRSIREGQALQVARGEGAPVVDDDHEAWGDRLLREPFEHRRHELGLAVGDDETDVVGGAVVASVSAAGTATIHALVDDGLLTREG